MPDERVVPVTIYGQRYPVRSDLDPAYVARLASYVDERMRAAGFSEAGLAQIHSPIGLAIGAASPAEIGIAIVAEIIAARRKVSGMAEKVA